MSEESSNKTIAKNTLFLYLRMFISLGLSLITGRVVLRTLGVEDYGINAVVGGVLGMFGVIQTSMIGATSRFITYELGKGDKKRLSDTFSTTLTIHIIIGVILVVLLETVGLWFLNNKLVIPGNRMFAANVIYQFSVFSTMLGVTQTPYSSTMVAHEKLNVYAYFDVLNMALKLVIIYILLIGNMDKLILYGILTLCVSTFMLLLNRFYCIKHFEEAHYHFIWDKSLLKPIFSFSGWDIFGNFAVMARGEGIAMLINMFFGVTFNAAVGIANTVTAAVGGFTGNIIMAIRPQLVKRYATGDYDSMLRLMHQGTILSFILMTYLGVPLMSQIHFVLNLWLGLVPDYACLLTNLTLLFMVVGVLGSVVMTVVEATGKIKKTSICNGSIYILVIPLTYIAYSLGSKAWIPYAYNVFALFLGVLCNLYFMTTYIPSISLKKYIIHTFFPCAILFFVNMLACYGLNQMLEEGWLRLICSIVMTILITTTISVLYILDKETKAVVLNYLQNKFFKKYAKSFKENKKNI